MQRGPRRGPDDEELTPCLEQLYMMCLVIPILLPLPRSFFVNLQKKLGTSPSNPVQTGISHWKETRDRARKRVPTMRISSRRVDSAAEGEQRRWLVTSAPGRGYGGDEKRSSTEQRACRCPSVSDLRPRLGDAIRDRTTLCKRLDVRRAAEEGEEETCSGETAALAALARREPAERPTRRRRPCT